MTATPDARMVDLRGFAVYDDNAETHFEENNDLGMLMLHTGHVELNPHDGAVVLIKVDVDDNPGMTVTSVCPRGGPDTTIDAVEKALHALTVIRDVLTGEAGRG